MRRNLFFQRRVFFPSPAIGRGRTHQRGMTLIELMVGLAIGLLVILAAVGSLMMVRGSSRTMTDSAALEQQATLAMLQIGQQITQAGAINAFLEGHGPDGLGADAVTVAYAAGNPLVRFDIRPAGVAQQSNSSPAVPLAHAAVFGMDGDGSDTLSVSYAKPNDGSPAGSCSGQEASPLPGGAARLVSTFAVDGASASLTCAQDPFAASAAAFPAAAHVVEMRVSYLAVNGAGAVTFYKTAADVSAATGNDWSAINAVQVCLELVGERTAAPQQTLPEDCQGHPKTVNDARLHRIVRNTFYLRNS